MVVVLSDDLINKIAAGEVVERPASVVKELCENALDAGAMNVRVRLLEGGQTLISVSDDGSGMSREDAILSLSRHATSKLRSFDDLFEITTLGFRGEALPSIASVSRLTLTTSPPGATVGTRIRVENGTVEVTDAAAPGGTVVEVADLFFNTPARRKFLRRTSTELRHAQDAVLRLAMAYPETGFFVEHEGRSLLSSPGSSNGLVDRICAAVGPELAQYLVPLDERRLGTSVSGLVARPEFFLATARGMYTFVNRRYVRDRGLNAAIQRSMQEFLPSGRQPVLALFVEVDPRTVDVNVHPQKLEVRFSQAPLVHEVVSAALKRALHPEIKGSETGSAGQSEAAHYEWAVERFLSQARASTTGALPVVEELSQAGYLGAFGQLRPGLNQAPPPGYFGSLLPLATLGKRFVICEGRGSTLVVLDPHVVLERIQLCRLCQKFPAEGNHQSVVTTATVNLADDEVRLVDLRRSALGWLGLLIEPFGGREWAIRATAAEFRDVNWPRLLKRLLPELPVGDDPDRTDMLPSLRIIACELSQPDPRNWASGEMVNLLREFEKIDFSIAAIHASAVVLEVPILELERRARNPQS